MTEGRKCQILLLDEHCLDILVQPKLLTSELLEIVASHCKLKEKEYFGLAFQDETGHYNWLQQDKKVLEHDLPRKQGTNLVLAFLVRFYVECITLLHDTATVELFYHNAKQLVFKGHIECDSETVFELAAYVLQASFGDYVNDGVTKTDLKKQPLITTNALKEHPSIQYCEDRIIDYYKKIAGTSKGLAIVNYMTILERLPTYGIHYFEVKDKKDIPWWLGISNKGIGVYDKQDKNEPRRVFVWKTLENLYYRDKKFSIEVHDPKRVSVSRRTFGPGNVNVHAWFGATAQLTKSIWSMAVAQHQFYHERKTSKTSLQSVRSASQLATELSRSTSSLPGSLGSDISHSGSSASLPSLTASRFDLIFDPAETAKTQREMYTALKARREALEDILKKKTEELKLICIKEGELTGKLPPETPLLPGEETPLVRRRVGTAFSLDASMISANNNCEDHSKKLELELELQKQITNAAHKLASDKSVSRFVRKQRRHSFIKAQTKLKEMEKKLSEYHKTDSAPGSPAMLGKFDDHHVASPSQSPLVPRGPRSNYKQHDTAKHGHLESPIIHRINTSPTSVLADHESPALTRLPVTHSSPFLEEVYKPNAMHGTNYSRNQTYPAGRNHDQIQTGSHGDCDTSIGSHLHGSQDSGFNSINNVYNVNSRRTSRYESNQDLMSPQELHNETLENVLDNKRQLPPNHGSLEYKLNHKSYGSLERNLKKKKVGDYERQHSETGTSVSHRFNSSPNRFGKWTSKSEYDLSSKGKDYSTVEESSKEAEFPLQINTPNSIINPSRHPSVRCNDDRFNTSFTKSNEGNQSSNSDGHQNSTWHNDRYQLPMNHTDRHPSSSNQRLIELQVHHETVAASNYKSDRCFDSYTPSRIPWHDSTSTEPSPIIQSPTKRTFNEVLSSTGGDGDQSNDGQCYSPREFEGSRSQFQSKQSHAAELTVNVKYGDSLINIPKGTSSKIVTVTNLSPQVEVSKPFEMKDFYKYSEKLRRQRLVEQYHQALVGTRACTPSQHSSDGTGHSITHPVASVHQYGSSNLTSTPYSQGSVSSIISPVSSRHLLTNSPYTSQMNSKRSDTGYGIASNARTNSVTSCSSYGVSSTSTTSKIQYTVQSQSGRVLYKAQHQSSKHTHYQPPASLKCEPVKGGARQIQAENHEAPTAPSSSRTPQWSSHHAHQYSTPEQSVSPMMNMSSFHLSPAGSLSKAFSSEMLEWYDGEGNHSPTSV